MMRELADAESERINDIPCTLNKKAWENLIDENIDWLDKQPDTLEAKHIRQILQWIKTHRPDKQAERIKELEEVIEAALRISDLWTLKEVETMFEDEAKALLAMKTRFEQALKEK